MDKLVNDEIKFGDNDTLGALVANLVEADALSLQPSSHAWVGASPILQPHPARARAPAIIRAARISKLHLVPRGAVYGASRFKVQRSAR